MTDIEDIRNHLARCNQTHLLQFWDLLTEDEKTELNRDLKETDIQNAVTGFLRAIEKSSKKKLIDDNIKPVPKSLIGNVNEATSEDLLSYEDRTFRMIAESKIAVLVLAGGQGTRLGVSYPKGMYDVGLQSGKSLFQIQAERILRLEELAFKRNGQRGCIIWLVMTSASTMEPTLQFFEQYQYFGLCRRNIIIFEQFMLPSFSFEGKILLASKSTVSKSPDGNGGIYQALRDRGVLKTLVERGIKYVHVYSVDNILVKVGDPYFLGYCIHHDSDCGIKIVEKTEPEEPIGVLCLVNDKWRVIEYSEISPQLAEKRTDDGHFLYNAGNICNHVFSVEFLSKISESHLADLELHLALKKIPTVDEDGELLNPKEPNGFKLEKFIFDSCPYAENLAIWMVNRVEEFSALKNSDDVGTDCPSTARKGLYNLHRKWIEKNGGKFENADVRCEISPLLSYAGEGLEELVSGKTFSSPCYLKPDSR